VASDRATDREAAKQGLEEYRRLLGEVSRALLEAGRELEEAEKAYKALNEALASKHGLGWLELEKRGREAPKLYFKTLTGKRVPIEDAEALQIAIRRSEALHSYRRLAGLHRTLLKAFKEYEGYVNYHTPRDEARPRGPRGKGL